MIEKWIVNALIMIVPISVLFCRQVYKDLKKEREINKLQRRENDILIEQIKKYANNKQLIL